ncbi:dermonecrotic toxin domain-containing protein [Pseudomonas sp. R4-35-07]|uniref:dermonecrotic toxin domain-containing protein n=1 Tax=Pseudomonas sp. R4-35-07 TaxID=658643 RepID=UPI000F57FFD8
MTPVPTTPRAPAENLLKKTVEAQFLTRPSLRSVATQMLTYTLKEQFPSLSNALSDLCLALPRDGGGRALHPLLEVALKHMADGSFPDLSVRHNLDSYLSDATGTRLTLPANEHVSYDLNVVESVIRELPLIVFIGFQDALTEYWNQDSDAGGSRWQWLAGLLQGLLRASAIRQSGDDAQQLQILSTLANCPSREARAKRPWPDNSIHAYTLETHLVRAATTLTLQSSDILVVSGERVFLCTVSGRIEPYTSLDAFGEAWGKHVAEQFIADKITWQLYEPDGDIFEVQAALALNQHLEDLAAVRLPGATTVSDMETLFASITNPATLFALSPLTAIETLSPIQAALPRWLQDASPADRFVYRQCLLEQASFRRLTQGEGYLDGLDDIRTYATRHLNHQLCLKRNAVLHAKAACTDVAQSKYKADELELSFDVPVGTLQSGYIEKVTMSLVDLALKNLSGKPRGRMTLRNTAGLEIETWLTTAYVDELIQRVNVGLNYPAYIQQQLLSDTPEAEKRKRMFCGQRPVALKMQALEHKIKGEAGLTPRGLRCVRAVVGTHRTERWVDADEIVMRTLAFQRKPGAKADVVQNMFIIEPRDTQSGPHLLYRPAYRESLLEFASRDSLLEAIAQPGTIQESVLAWLADDARDIYSHGGFKEPHYIRISGIGSEFDPLPGIPKPATLASADAESNDQILQALNRNELMEYLFVCEACQLLDQADRESTSNTESRWALILEGVQLGFNTLLMLVRGPLAAVGWFMQLALSLNQDLPALTSEDPIARELAWVDLLLNIGMVLIHHGLPTQPSGGPLLEDNTARQPLAGLPLRRPPGRAGSGFPLIERGIVGLPSEPPGGGRTLLDVDRSLAGDSAAARLLEKLLEVNTPWPEPVPEPIAIGALKGLFKVDNHWHASVGGLFFRVTVVPGFDEVFIVHPDKPNHPGIKLSTDGNGHWTLDRGLKLTGGGPKRVAALREENRRQLELLQGRMQELNVELTHGMAEFRTWLTRMNSSRDDLIKQISTLKLVWRLLQNATDAQKTALQTRHEQEISSYSKIRVSYEVSLDILEKKHALLLPRRIELYKVGQDLERCAGARGHVQDRAITLKSLWDDQLRLHLHLQKWADTFLFSDRGEPMNNLVQRMLPEIQSGRPWHYNDHVTRLIELADVIQRMAVRSREMETTLELLEQDSAVGRVIREELLAKISVPQHFFSENLEIHALIPLSRVVVKLSAVEPSPLELLYIKHLDESRLSEVLLSHTEVRSSTGYPLEEQRLLYDTILGKYRSYASAIEALTFVNPQRVHLIAERLLSGLRRARTLAENELEAVVRSQEALEVEASLAKLRRPKARTKRIFKTRNRHYLVGDLRPADGQHPQEHFTITNPFFDETVTSFEQFEADTWVEKTLAPMDVPEPAPQARSLAAIKSQGEKLVQQRTEIERAITAQQHQLENPFTRQDVNPADWDELLTGQAKKLTDLADEIAREHRSQPSAQDLIDNYRAHARDMQRMAKRVCSEAYKRQWPTLQSLEYLWRQKEIDINLTSQADPQRPTLSGDFFTEYAVYDKAQRPPTVLWYAHFHYASADAPAARYTRAHLKLASQRKYTQKDLLKQHVQALLHSQQEPGAEPIEKILYVLIVPPQDQLFLAIAPAP